LSPLRMIGPFSRGNLRNLGRRILYSYFLRNFSPASLELLIAPPLLIFGVLFGMWHWLISLQSSAPATAGTVMVAALPILIGLQLLISWLNFDVAAEPRVPIHPLLAKRS